MKPNLDKPFSIAAHEAGGEFCTRNGCSRRVLAIDIPGNCPVLACDEKGNIYKYGGGIPHCNYDLFEIIPEPTHREDGTPMDIDPLPEVDGWRFEYRGEGWSSEGKKNFVTTLYQKTSWDSNLRANYPQGYSYLHYAEAFRVAKPTTLEDLYPEGESVCWIHGIKALYPVAGVVQSYNDDGMSLRIDGKWKIISWFKDNYRYSNSPLTKWEDATPFVVKEAE